MNSPPDFYVYGYYDPRSYRLFYVGKGRRGRKLSHLKDGGHSKKARIISAIRKATLSPVIKVIAANLTEREALLVETSLIWALGPTLANEVAGSVSDAFRPVNSLHQQLPGFDTNRGVYLLNIGQGPTRSWADCRKYGFLAAGGGKQWSRQLERLTIGDIVVPYLKGYGYVGIGRVRRESVPVSEFRYKGRALSPSMLRQPDLLRRTADAERSEYLVGVRWLRAVAPEEAKFRRRASLFTTQLIVASLAAQPRTLQFIERSFGIDIGRITAGSEP